MSTSGKFGLLEELNKGCLLDGVGVGVGDPSSESKSFKETTEVVDSESMAQRDNPHFTEANSYLQRLYFKLRNKADILGNDYGARIR